MKFFRNLIYVDIYGNVGIPVTSYKDLQQFSKYIINEKRLFGEHESSIVHLNSGVCVPPRSIIWVRTAGGYLSPWHREQATRYRIKNVSQWSVRQIAALGQMRLARVES